MVAAVFWPRDNATASNGAGQSEAEDDGIRLVGASGLPVPRFVSLKADRVNVRIGPSTKHQVMWVYSRKNLPVEVVAEFEHWRRVRDSDGTEGWVYHSMLQGRRTALIAPWRKGTRLTLLDSGSPDGRPKAVMEAGVLGRILECDGTWCRFSAAGYTGWIQQEFLWGVYPNEKLG